MEYNTDYLRKRLQLGKYDERILKVMCGYVIKKFMRKHNAKKIKESIYEIDGNKVYVSFFKFEKEGGRTWEVPSSISLEEKLSEKFEEEFPSLKEIEENISYFLDESPKLKIPPIIKEYFESLKIYCRSR